MASAQRFSRSDSPARRSFVPEMVRGEDVPNGVVLYSMTTNVARIFGPALAGVLVVTVGYGWCFTLDAISYLTVLVCLLMMRPAELHRRAPKPREKGEVRAGLAYVRSMPTLWISLVMLIIVGTLAYNFTVTLPLFVKDALHAPVNTGFTLLYSVFSLGAVMGGLIVAHRELVRIRHVVLGAVSIGAVLVVLAFVPTVWAAAPVVLLLGMASILYDLVDGDRTGRSHTRDARAGPVTAKRHHRRRGAHRRSASGLDRRLHGWACADHARGDRRGRYLPVTRDTLPLLEAVGNASGSRGVSTQEP